MVASVAHRATVTQASPLRVRPDGSTSDAPALKAHAADSYALNDRVAYVRLDSEILVIGKPA